MKIHIETYNSEWKKIFKTESKLLKESIKEKNLQIEHIGSTSIEGLGAKPIIDIMIGLENFNTADNHIKTFESIGYQYIAKHEDIMPYRRFFIKENKDVKTHHVHVVQYGSEFWIRHLLFRDHLRTNPKDLEAYYQLKLKLAELDWESGTDYANAKSVFIHKIVEKASKKN